ncbi:MAG: family 16 glycoside hydrolase [Egibacteraceae bacterium]
MGNARVLWLKSAFVAVVAMALVGCGALGEAQAVAGSAGSTAEPNLVYEADWSSGIGGWAGGTGWKTLNGALLNDGTGDFFGPLFADFDSGSLADLAVEAEIRVTRGSGTSFGIEVRVDGNGGGYAAGLYKARTFVWYLDGGNPISEGEAFDPGGDWHTYRVEAKDNVVTLLVDGAVLAEVADNKYLEGGQVSLWSNDYQLEVRSFKVFAI